MTQEESMDSLEYRLAYLSLIKLINEGQGGYFSTRHAWRVHSDSVNGLNRKLYDESFDGKTVVVTHHGPSKLFEHKIFGRSDFSGALYSDLPNLIEQTDIWVYGLSMVANFNRTNGYNWLHIRRYNIRFPLIEIKRGKRLNNYF